MDVEGKGAPAAGRIPWAKELPRSSPCRPTGLVSASTLIGCQRIGSASPWKSPVFAKSFRNSPCLIPADTGWTDQLDWSLQQRYTPPNLGRSSYEGTLNRVF